MATKSDLPSVDITPDQDGGILKQVKREGTIKDDKPYKGDNVRVHYVGTLEDGTEFDSSRSRGEHFKFGLGKGQVIKGWDIGVASMAKGELAVFTIKSEYGYGETGSPPKIPGGATLIFEIELFDFTGEDETRDKDGGVIKRVLQPGDGLDMPNDNCPVEISLKAWRDGNLIDERDVKFTTGEGLDQNVPIGVEICLEKMKLNERAKVWIKPKYGFGRDGCKDLGIPPGDNQTLVYEIALNKFERATESWQLEGNEKLAAAKVFKEKGSAYLHAGKHMLAMKKYKQVIEYLEHEISLTGEEEEDRKNTLQAGRLNLALVYLKITDWIECRNLCTKVIEENPSAVKAYYRRGEALIKLNDLALAKDDFSHILKLEKDNQAAAAKVAHCIRVIKLQKEKEKRTYANMFDGLAEENKEKKGDSPSGETTKSTSVSANSDVKTEDEVDEMETEEVA